MNNNYNSVPNIITGKDLDYLSDMFNWNYDAYKKYSHYEKVCEMEDLKSIFNEASNLFRSNFEQVLNILQGGSNGQ